MSPVRLSRVAALAVALAVPAVAPAQTALQFRPDAATFLYNDDQSMVEVYLSFRAGTLPFVAGADGFKAAVPARVRLLPVSQGAPAGAERAAAYDETTTFRYVVPDTTGLTSEQVFVEQLRFVAPPGEYELEVVLAPEGQSTAGAVLDLSVPAYAQADGPRISGVELATVIGRAEDGDAMAKSGLSIRPNPDAYYGADVPVRYYAEVYDPPAAGPDAGYTLLAFLAESATGAPMPGLERRTTRPAREVDVVVGSVDVAAVPSGIYYLRLVVLDEANNAVAEQAKRVFVINPGVEVPGLAAGAMSYEETLFAAMGEEELRLNVRHAAVIANNRERQQIDALETDDDRRAFLAAFWSGRDDDGLPTVNGARRTFYERLATVNDRFGEPGRLGFESDRGRVYLTYGPPSELDRQPYDPQYVQHEIWNYENLPGEGRSIFVFADRYNSSQMELVHSNVTGEVSVASWRQEILR